MLWRVTGDERYREWGWHMFRAWHRFCRVPTGGFANLESVLTARSQHWPHRALSVCCFAVTNCSWQGCVAREYAALVMIKVSLCRALAVRYRAPVYEKLWRRAGAPSQHT